MRAKCCIVGTAVAVLAGVGTIGAGVAHASGITLGVTPSSGLATDPSTVQVSVSGATVINLGRIYIRECGNAYANGTPLPATPIDNDQDCTTIGWIDSPFNPGNFTVKETGIGNGNRSCVAVAHANRPCFIDGPTGRNEPALPTPQVPISFAQDPTGTGAQPSVTSTMLTAIGSPIATGKAQHALVQVMDGSFAPDGTVTVTEGSTTVGTGTMTDGIANVVMTPSLGLGSHTLVAHYPGDGSFLASDSAPVTMSIVGPLNISMGDVSIVNGVGGSRAMAFPVVLSQPPTAPVQVPYTLVPGTAHPGVDYVAAKAGSVVNFKAGPGTVKYIVVKLLSDTSPTGTKNFTVQLGNPTLGSFVLRRPIGTGTIYDPDSGGLTANVGSVSMPEGDVGGAHIAKFPVTLSAAPTALTTVTVEIRSTLTDTAIKNKRGSGDYQSRLTIPLMFRPGVAPHVGTVTQYATAQIWPDTQDELDETFTVQIIQVTSTQSFTIGSHGTAAGVILSDE